MARMKTATDGPIILKAKLDPLETAPALGKGQPVRVTSWPIENTATLFLVKICPDGEVPDFVVGNLALSASSPGDIMISCYPAAPALLGGTVKKGDLLTVKGAKFVKAVAGNKAVGCASMDGVADDLIPIIRPVFTAP
jgi:hypothetical protein